MPTLSKPSYRPRPAMNVTPLVDVVLVLLIIFMVVIPMMEKSVAVELPRLFNADEDPKGKTDPFTLSLTSDGRAFFEEQAIAMEDLTAHLRTANQREPTRRIVLRGDRGARYGEVRRTFRICQELGFPGVSLRVNERRESDAR